MKAERLIKELTQAVKKHGNIKVTHSAYGETVASSVKVYDRHNNDPDMSGLKAVEIHIH